MKSDGDTTIQELKDLMVKFVTERHWQKHHTPKNLSMSLSIEAAELMEHYLWDRGFKPQPEEVADELADVMMNLLSFATAENIDITEAFMKKYRKTNEKYPVDTFNQDNDTLEDYYRIKKEYRKNKNKDLL